jgi:SAM-dependent methyltransferase
MKHLQQTSLPKDCAGPNIQSGNPLIRLLKYNFVRRKYYQHLQSKYKQHSFNQSFDWDWEKTNYNRIALVNLLISKKQDPVYLEIGCGANHLFDSVPAKQKVGVDPASGGNVRATSDGFFSKNEQLFDVVFIDGLHTYEQAHRDLINSIRFLKPGGYIALHDLLPRSWIEHHVPRINDVWTGDTWKVAFELSKSEGIDFRIVKIDHGIGVFKLTRKNPVLVDLAVELKNKEFEYFFRNIERLPLVEWHDFLIWLEHCR